MTLLVRIFKAIQRARRTRADREVLARLDARTLRDIGLQSWNAELAQRLDSQKQRHLLRQAAARIGVY